MSENTEQLVIPEPKIDVIARIPIMSNKIHGIDLSRDGKRLLNLSNNQITFYQAEPYWNPEKNYMVSRNGYLIPKFSHDGSMIFCRTDKQNVIELRRIVDWELIRQFQGHRSAVTHMVISPDGKKLASIEYWNAIIKIWDVADGTHERQHIIGSNYAMVFSTDSDRLVLFENSNFFQKVYQISHSSQCTRPSFLTYACIPTSAVFYENGLIFGTKHGLQRTPHFDRTYQCKPFEIKDLEAKSIRFLMLSENEKILAAVTSDGNMQFIDLSKQAVISRLFLGKQVTRIALDAVRQRLALVRKESKTERGIFILDFGSPNFGTTKLESNSLVQKPTCVWDEMPI